MILHREQRKLLNTLEKDAADALTVSLLSDFLFGSADGKDLPHSLDDIKRFKELLTWNASQWAELLQKYYLDNPSLTVIGKPSAKMAVRLEKETAERLQKTQAKFGEEGLRKLEEQLKKAQEQNDLDIPPEMLSSFKIPDVAGIRWIDVKSAAAGTNEASFDNAVQSHLKKDKVDLPYYVQFEHVQSNFIEVCIYFDAAALPVSRELLPVYLESLFSLPLTKADGTKVPYEEVVAQLDTETVDYGVHFGSGLSEQIEVNIKVEKDKYHTAIRWLRDLLFHTELDVARLRVN